MRRLRVPLTVLLVFLIAVDALVGYRLWTSGWPIRLSGTIEGEVAKIQVTPISFTASDWFILILVVSAHALLIFLISKAWGSGSVRV